jgi:hypothetical protein
MNSLQKTGARVRSMVERYVWPTCLESRKSQDPHRDATSYPQGTLGDTWCRDASGSSIRESVDRDIETDRYYAAQRCFQVLGAANNLHSSQARKSTSACTRCYGPAYVCSYGISSANRTFCPWCTSTTNSWCASPSCSSTSGSRRASTSAPEYSSS